ncbi:LCP family protein [Shimazuella sp. AN120528]|uniref:LCP family protein n=1 Tax=Shimazuella soli TaxID=1892854 RepID=UPI001F0FF94C|nr:LCP family protein [Shimazuella soli]MCH5586624.1 LCP family protein [Shimazuella soli]
MYASTSTGKRTPSRMKKLHKKNKKKWMIRSLIIFFVILIGIGCYIFFTFWNALGKGYKDAPISQYRSAPVTLDKPFTLLLMGTDNYNSDKKKLNNPEAFGERTDVLMLLAVNPEKKQALIVNIPRDTIVPIANTNGVRTKINAAYNYAFGGLTNKKVDPTQNVLDTVSNFLGGVAIDYYAHINFKGFIDLVNAVGGVDVYVPYSFHISTFDRVCRFKTGPMHLNGECALPYVRQRHNDPNGDHGRNIRQQQVIEKLISKLGSFSSLTDVSGIANAIGDNLSYDIPPSNFLPLASLYKSIPKKNIEQFQGGVLGGTSANNGVSLGKSDYVVIKASDKQKLYEKLVEMGIPHGAKPDFVTYKHPSSGK